MEERSPRDPRDPLDEEAAWAEIVAGYGKAPAFPDEDGPVSSTGPRTAGEPSGSGGTDTGPARADLGRTGEDRADGGRRPDGKPPEKSDPGRTDRTDRADRTDPADCTDRDDGGLTVEERPRSEPSPGAPDGPGKNGVGSFVVFAPGVGPRDWSVSGASGASGDDLDGTDEGHFVPPEPPPLPKADVTAKFAWIAVLGGPLLLVLMVLLQQPVTWWLTLLGIGGFLGGFATLVARMKHDDEDDEELPGGGAVV
ncbi:hypothetical protein [Streptomyces monomycini]|uniref:hypothetical protein n=1 Tax=Streptomyces monomycini TaxID=371720 RepID=UPI0004AA2926|nr:hypothetical protein [Streptomyces monomycini]